MLLAEYNAEILSTAYSFVEVAVPCGVIMVLVVYRLRVHYYVVLVK